jgi:hypothetical protein
LAPAYGNNRSTVVNEAIKGLAEAHGITLPPENHMLLDILDSSGKSLRIINHEGQHYAVAPPSGSFKLRLNNTHSTTRSEFVVSVDGIDIIDGEAASQTKRGYVLQARASSVISGWRRSDSKVAAFEFVSASTGESYAAKTGRPANQGVIAVACYREYTSRQNVSWDGRYKSVLRSAGSGLGNLSGSIGGHEIKTSGGLNLGTGYGKEVEMQTLQTSFQRAAGEAQVLVVYYATAEALRAMGVPVDSSPGVNPWPADGPSVKAPPGWTP